MKIILLAEAQQQFEAEDAWWRQHRGVKELFREEFHQALEQVNSTPETGQRYRRARGKLIQRVLMKKTRCQVPDSLVSFQIDQGVGKGTGCPSASARALASR